MNARGLGSVRLWWDCGAGSPASAEPSPGALPEEARRRRPWTRTRIRRAELPSPRVDAPHCFVRGRQGRDGQTSNPTYEVRTPGERAWHKRLVSLLLFTWMQKNTRGGYTIPLPTIALQIAAGLPGTARWVSPMGKGYPRYLSRGAHPR